MRELGLGVTVPELEDAIRASWDALTAERPEQWTADNPAYLQCSATALAVRELLGGQILVAPVAREDSQCGFHAWNRLLDGTELDLTREQFRAGEVLGNPEVRQPVRCWLASALLFARVQMRLGLPNIQ